jgi:hypothetical protein
MPKWYHLLTSIVYDIHVGNVLGSSPGFGGFILWNNSEVNMTQRLRSEARFPYAVGLSIRNYSEIY